MSKLAPETITSAPGEIKLIDFDFDGDLDTGKNLTGTPTFVISSGGPTQSNQATSGTKAQGLFDFTSVAEGTYTIDATVQDDSTPAQTFKGRGRVTVSNLG